MLQYFTLFFPNVTRRAEGCDDIRALGYLTSDQRDSNFRERLNKAERDFHTSVITEHHLLPEIHTHLHSLWKKKKKKKKHYEFHHLATDPISHTITFGCHESAHLIFLLSPPLLLLAVLLTLGKRHRMGD